MGILKRSMRDEGPRFLFKGWTPAFVRLGPNTVLLFVFFEVRRSDLRKVTAPYSSFPKATQERVGCYGAQTAMITLLIEETAALSSCRHRRSYLLVGILDSLLPS